MDADDRFKDVPPILNAAVDKVLAHGRHHFVDRDKAKAGPPKRKRRTRKAR